MPPRSGVGTIGPCSEVGIFDTVVSDTYRIFYINIVFVIWRHLSTRVGETQGELIYARSRSLDFDFLVRAGV